MMFPPAATWTRAVGLRGQGYIYSSYILLYLAKIKDKLPIGNRSPLNIGIKLSKA